MHSVKKRNLKATILKLDLSKAYDGVDWTFLRLVLIHMGMNVVSVNWIMGCIQSVSFAVLINNSPSTFFGPSRGLCQGFPLSPFLFLLVAEALSRMIKEAHSIGTLRGIKVSKTESVSHLLFVDDIFVGVYVSLRDLSTLKNILTLFCIAIGMKINLEKSNLLLNHCSEVEEATFTNLFLARRRQLNEGIKYLGFNLKPDCYKKEDWAWLIRKVEA
jgi:hypothetical protein